MTAKRLLWLCLALWALAFAASFAMIWLTPATGDGFTRGLNRVSRFLGWQTGAGLLALAIWAIGRKFENGSTARRVSRVPAAAFALLVAGIAAVILVSALRKPSSEGVMPPPTKPTTAVGEG